MFFLTRADAVSNRYLCVRKSVYKRALCTQGNLPPSGHSCRGEYVEFSQRRVDEALTKLRKANLVREGGQTSLFSF